MGELGQLLESAIENFSWSFVNHLYFGFFIVALEELVYSQSDKQTWHRLFLNYIKFCFKVCNYLPIIPCYTYFKIICSKIGYHNISRFIEPQDDVVVHGYIHWLYIQFNVLAGIFCSRWAPRAYPLRLYLAATRAPIPAHQILIIALLQSVVPTISTYFYTGSRWTQNHASRITC